MDDKSYDRGYRDALLQVRHFMTTGGGRTEAYEETMNFIDRELG